MKVGRLTVGAASLAAAVVLLTPAMATAAATAKHERTQILDWNAPVGSQACVTDRSITLAAGQYWFQSIDPFGNTGDGKYITVKTGGVYNWRDCVQVNTGGGFTSAIYHFTTSLTENTGAHDSYTLAYNDSTTTSASYTWGSLLDPQF